MSTLKSTGPEAAVVCVVRRELPAKADAVYRAWTDSAQLRRWSWGAAYDTRSVEQDCREGGAWRQHIRDKKSGENWYFDGVFREVVPGRRLVHTFHFRSDRGADEGPSLVAIDFVPKGERTEVVITHSQLLPEKKQGTEAGWNEVLEAVERCVGGK